MKKTIILSTIIIYIIGLTVLRQYPESHILSFLLGILSASSIVLFLFIIAKKAKL